MVYCSECGKKNEDNARYCDECGNSLVRQRTLEKEIKMFVDDVGRGAEELAKKAEKFGIHLAKKTAQFGKQIAKETKEFAKALEQFSQSDAKHCPDCSTELKYNAKFCWKCGKKIEF